VAERDGTVESMSTLPALFWRTICAAIGLVLDDAMLEIR
jgi:hypothetical protein